MQTKTPNRTPYHWLVVAACSMLACSSIGIVMNCAGIFYTTVASDLGVGRGDIALYSTIVNLVNGLMGPVVAMLIKKINLRAMLIGGLLLVSCGLASFSMAASPIHFYITAFFVGLGVSLIGSVPMATILSNWFFQSYGLASGIALSFSGVGGALLTPLFNSIISSAGWRSAYLVAAVLAAVLTLPGILFVLRLRPEEKGLFAYGSTEPKVVSEKKKAAVSKGKLFRSPIFIGACLFPFLASGITSMGSHFPGYAGELELPAAAGALMVSACMVGNISFKLILGALSDRIGPKNACLIMLSSNAAALLGLLFVPAGSTVLPLLFAFFFGAIYSVAAVGASLVVKHIFGPEQFSTVYSYVTMTTCLGSALMVTTSGYLYDFFQTYRVGIVVYLCFVTLAAATVLFISKKAEKEKA